MDHPFLRILTPYLCGCIIALYLRSDFLAVLSVAALATTLFLLSFIWRRGVCAGCSLVAALLALGLTRMWIANLPTDLELLVDEEITFEGTLAYQPDRLPGSRSAVLMGQFHHRGRQVRQKVWLRTPENLPDIHYGCRYSGTGVLRRPSPQRNPGGYDTRKYLARQGIRVILHAKECNQSDVPGGDWLLHRADRLRHRVEAVLDASVHNHPEHAPVLRGILLGQRRQIADETLGPIQASGLLHLFAVSGLHVGFLAGTIYLLVGFVRYLSERWKIVLTMAITGIYVMLVGFRPSAVRAGLLIELVLLARWINRDYDLLNLLALVAFGLLVWNPLLLTDVAFQLSFLVTGTIVVLVPRWWQSLRGRWSWIEGQHWGSRALVVIVQTLLVSGAAQIASQPLIAYYFHRAYPLAILSNLLAALLAWWVVVTSSLCVMLGLVWLPLAGFFGYALQMGIVLLLGWTRWTSSIPGAMLWLTHAQAIMLFLVPVVVLLLSYWDWIRACAWRLMIPASALPILIWWGMLPIPPTDLEVTFLDVGQGDCAVVRFPDGKTLLIDTGPRTLHFDAGESIVWPYLLHENIRHLDAVLITHPESDHNGGLEALKSHLRIGEIWGNGRAIELGERAFTDTTKLTVLHPTSEFLQEPGLSKNEKSVVLRIDYGDVSLLFVGDIEEQAEQSICNHHRHLGATVLKVSHHGSRTSSSRSFLEAVSPEISIISCGDDPDGHFPNTQVLERLHQLRTQVLRTDLSGAIRVRTDGQTCWITTWVGRDEM